MVNTPQIGRTAVPKIGSNTIGYTKTAKITENIKAVTEYCTGTPGSSAQWPAVAFAGNASGSIEIGVLYVDNTYVTLLEAGSTVTVEVDPSGTVAGMPKDTYTCIITKWTTDVQQEKLTQGSMSLEITAKPTHTSN